MINQENTTEYDKDFLDNKINIGDRVIFEAPGYRQFVFGKVITKALKSCQIEYINDWNYEGRTEVVRQGYGQIIKDPSDLINRQKAEIERLKKECEAHRNTVIENEQRFLALNLELASEIDKQYEQAKADILGNISDGGTSCHWCIAQHESEARKEFAEIILNHLQQRIDECDNMTSEDPIWVNRLKWARESIVIFIHECLHKLEKEMESESHAE